MHAYDLSPLFRSSVGFDRLSGLIDSAFKMDDRGVSYPPYNIIKSGEDTYVVEMAVAGFSQDEITITVQENKLTITARHEERPPQEGVTYLHKGIATRNFERVFSVADHVKVLSADLADGLLSVQLKREVPEASKPRTIAINGVAAKDVIDAKPAKK